MTLPEYLEGEYTPAQLKNLEHLEGFAPHWYWGRKGAKRPLSPKGRPERGSSDDPLTAGTLAQALAAMKRRKGGTVGLLISASSPGLVGCDIDNVINDAGEIHRLGLEAIKQFAGAYLELSPSRTGLRIFCTGAVPADTPKGSTAVGEGVKFEAYTHGGAGRWLRMTGALIPSTAGAVAPCQDGINWLAGVMTAAKGSTAASPDKGVNKASPDVLSLDDVFAALAELRPELLVWDVIDAIKAEVAGKPRSKLAEAWRGNLTPWKDDHSVADLFMACESVRRGAGHVDDAAEIWGESALANRDKFNRKDYRAGTIENAARAVLRGLQAKLGKAEVKPWQEREGMKGVPEAMQEAGEEMLVRKGGGLAASRENVVLLLRRTPALQGLFWFDEFSQTVMRAAGCRVLDSGANCHPGKLEEDDLLRLGIYLSRVHGMSLQIPELLQAVNGSARDVGNRRNPVRASLENLRAGWDGRPRLDSWIEKHCMPAPGQGREYLALVGRMFFVQSVARVFQPGCKADTLMILCGDGGGRKSSLFRALADEVEPGLFRDTSFDLSDPKALVEQTAGSLFVELAELSSMRRARDVQAVKSALSGQVDRHRRPYAAMVEDCARSFTFVGSTNDETWITDPSGGQGRRFWPVQTTSSKDKPMNLAALAAEAGQLWGEAVAAYQAGEQWFIDADRPEHAEASKQWDAQLGARMVVGPWDEPLDSFLLQQAGPGGAVRWSLQEVADGMGYAKAKEDDAAFHKLAGMVKARGLEKKKTEAGMRWQMTAVAYAYLEKKFGVGVNQLGRAATALKKESLSKGKALRAV